MALALARQAGAGPAASARLIAPRRPAPRAWGELRRAAKFQPGALVYQSDEWPAVI